MRDTLTILVDQDGPLTSYDGAFYDLCVLMSIELHGGRVDKAHPCAEHRYLTDCIVSSVERKRVRMQLDSVGWFEHLNPVPGALDGINRLAEVPGVEVFICTKPSRTNRTCHSEKAQWVSTFLGKDWESRLIITPNKGMIRGAVLLDDGPKKEWFDYAEWTPVIFPMSWNHPDGPFSRETRIDDEPRWTWADPVEKLVDIAASHAYGFGLVV